MTAAGPHSFAGTGRLLRLVLRRDRLRIAVWASGIVALVTVSARSVIGLYDTPESLQSYARLVRDNAALIVQAGPGYGLDDPTVGAVLMNEVGIWAFIAISLMSVFMVVRHTRAEEESDRADLIHALPIGRLAALAAAVAATTLTSLLIATAATIALVASGLPLLGSAAFGAALAGVGSVFAGVAANTAQVASAARTSVALGGGALALAFVARAIGDVGDGRLSWLSPIGWAQGIRAFADERWWVLMLPLVATSALVASAGRMRRARDLGAGLIEPRPGRAEATPRFSTPLGLAFRLQRATIIGWSTGMALLGFFYGIVADQAESMLADNPELEDFFARLGEGSITDAFLSTAMSLIALMVTGYSISAVLRLRTEELATRADTVLTTPTSRREWASSHLVLAIGGSAIALAAAGGAMGVAFAAATGNAREVPRLLFAALVMLPAIACIVGLAFAIYGVHLRSAVFAWALLVFAATVGLLGGVLDLPTWVMDLSPYQHVPALPSAPFSAVPIVVLCLVAAGFVAAGCAALDRRDIG